MSITVPVVSTSGAKTTVTLTDPVVTNSILVANYATPQLAANAASGKRLVFPANQTYTITAGAGLAIPANCYVEGNNSTLRWPNGGSGSNDELLRVTGSGVTVDNLNLDGNKANQTNWEEHRHSIRIEGAYVNITVKNCDFTNIIGDGVYIRTLTVGPVIIGPNNTFQANYDNRNGVSITGGDGIEIFQNTFTNLSRPDMPGHIDIEPNTASDTCHHIDIHDNVFNGGTLAATGTRPAVTVALLHDTICDDIKVRNNDISGTRFVEGITVVGHPNNGPFNPSTNIVVSNNNIHGIGSTGKYGVRLRYYIGAQVINNTINGVQWGIYNQSACLLSSTGNTYVGVTTPITQQTPHCS